MSRILAIGDIHEPYSRKGYLEFCQDLYDEWRCDIVMFMGDVADFHAVSFYAKHPEMPNASKEYELTFKAIQKWKNSFPKAKVCIGNHCSRLARVAGSVNIPSQLLRSYEELWDTPKWDWRWDFILDDIYYAHGTGNGGIHPAYNMMRKMALSVVIGHNHHAAGIKYLVNPQRRLFGMDTGAGCDDRQLAFAYNQYNKIRSVIGAGIILNGVPYYEIMPMGKNEKYEDIKFKG